MLLPYPNKLNESWWNGNEVTIFLAVDIKEAAGEALDELLLPFDDFDFDSLDDFNFESGWFDGSFVAVEEVAFSLSASNSLLSSFSFLILFEFFFDFLLTLIIFSYGTRFNRVEVSGKCKSSKSFELFNWKFKLFWKKKPISNICSFDVNIYFYQGIIMVSMVSKCGRNVERGIKDCEKEQRF